MDCNNAIELITASLDGELEASLDIELQRHFGACPRCRNEAELERMTKAILHRRRSQQKTPPRLAMRISSQLAHEKGMPRPAGRSRFRQLFTITGQLRKIFLSLGGVVAALIFTFTLLPSPAYHSHIVPNDASIIHQTYSSFDGLIKGSTVPQIASDDPSAVKAFFAQKVNFSVSVPRLKSCRLMGGIFSRYNNENVAQVVYKLGSDVIYMYEARLKCVMKDGGALNLPQEARDAIRRDGRYVENHVPDCTLIVWKADSTTVCCAVAEMNKERLMACLREVN